MDRTTVFVVGVCLVLLFSWNYIFGPNGLNMLPQSQTQAQNRRQVAETQKYDQTLPRQSIKQYSSTQIAPQSIPSNLSGIEDRNNQLLPGYNASSLETEKEFSPITIDGSGSHFSVTVNPVSGCITHVELKDILESRGKENVILNRDVMPTALSVSERNNEWQLVKVYPVQSGKDFVTVKRQMTDASGKCFILTQTWKIAGTYSLNYSFSILNIGKIPIKFQELDVWAGALPPVEFLSGDVARSESHRIDALLEGSDQFWTVKAENKRFSDEEEQNNSIKWVAVSNKYFANILKATDKNGAFYGGNLNLRIQKDGVSHDGKQLPFYFVTSAGRIKNIIIPAEGSVAWNYAYYSGPKEISVLKAFDPKTAEIMHLAFTSLETIAQWLLYLLIYLKDVTGNYGWAIILLTVIVKLVFWPITHRSNVSMKRMQRLQPMVKDLREQYKDDKQKLNQKMMELYKREKVNPLGGCLPILVQIPVFFALYWTLDGAIELRHTSFLWIADLTKPDTIAHIFGLPVNPLAISMALTMFLQQKMTPTASMDPAQAKMMLFMPLIMLVFLYNLPSGLTLYWTISQVISIVQLMHNKYSDKKENEKQLKTTTAKEKKK